MLQVGNKAPEFEAILDDGTRFKLSDWFGNKHVVLYFYPKDFTPGCIAEACGFRDNHDEIKDQDAVVVGISPDPPATHRRFKEKYDITFPLIADPRRTVIKLYQADRTIGIPSTKRVTYLVDKTGVVRGVYHHEIAIGRHQRNVIRELRDINRVS